MEAPVEAADLVQNHKEESILLLTSWLQAPVISSERLRKCYHVKSNKSFSWNLFEDDVIMWVDTNTRPRKTLILQFEKSNLGNQMTQIQTIPIGIDDNVVNCASGFVVFVVVL